MERTARRVRQNRMMDQRPLRGRAGFLGILGAGLLFAAVSGCGSVVASDSASAPATFAYAASGCEQVSVTAAGKTLSTGVYGRAAAAAPHLATDLAVILEGPKP